MLSRAVFKSVHISAPADAAAAFILFYSMILRTLTLLLLVVGFSACKDNTVDPPDGTEATFTLNSANKFYSYSTDTNAASYGQRIAGTDDTITTKVISVTYVKAGKSNVVAVLTTSQMTGLTDTIFYAQDDNGNVYRYNYGLETLGNDPTVIAALGESIDVGWVLMTKLNATVGDGWTTGFDTIPLPSGFGTAYLSDTATFKGKTTLSIGGQNYTAFHTTHFVRPSIPGHTASGTVENYFVPELGATVISETSPSAISGILFNGKFPGSYTAMYSKVK